MEPFASQTLTRDTAIGAMVSKWAVKPILPYKLLYC